MVTLQKFKLLATQCAIAAGSPTRSPTTSPVFHLRRRKTLRMLLSRGSASGRRLYREEESPDREEEVVSDSHPPPEKKTNKGFMNHTLKDLFISSPPPQQLQEENNLNKPSDNIRRSTDLEPFPSAMITNREDRDSSAASRRFAIGSYRLRLLLLKRAWRPVLIAIPESKETP